MRATRILLLLGALAFAVAAACGVDEADMVGTWVNQNGQALRVDRELHGLLTQTPSCAPVLSVFATRDPFDGFSIRFEQNQRVYYPDDISTLFVGDSFCSSQSSVPMCKFCVIDGDQMLCEQAEQEIVGAGASVVHNCTWTRSATASVDRPIPPGCHPKALEMICIRTSTTG
ncbi:MAG: hypothetical protein IT384_30745 [Deltaproteobacteria bacterium]|nr:hypothetical protein [Deltaproteobacteria bacterium]